MGHLGGGRVPRGGGHSAGDREDRVGQHRERYCSRIKLSWGTQIDLIWMLENESGAASN